MPESKQVAEHYVQARQVPASQVMGFELPTTESMTRAEFTEGLQKPLFKALTEKGLFSLASPEKPGTTPMLTNASIRYAVLCYGVPTKIVRDPSIVEPETDKFPIELRRNEAAVDSELACLPPVAQKHFLTGPRPNALYSATNASAFHPTNGILMVARLDGPSAAIAAGLVDKALEAETNGLWGRGYFDARGLTNGDYKIGDDWIRGAAYIAMRGGFETQLDDAPATYPPGFPMSQIAFYAGWYDWDVSGPFTQPTVEFMPGAFAYHLHSFSAQNLRSTTKNWVGPLLSKGATITLGCVDEPYLMGTPNVAAFLERFLAGYSFGEAAYAAQNWLSWQTTVIGDPLYRPFARRPEVLHQDLENRHSKLVEWAYLRAVNLRQMHGESMEGVIDLMGRIQLTRRSAVLQEKLGDLYWAQKKFSAAFDSYEQVLKLEPSPMQRLRVLLTLGERRSVIGPDRMAVAFYQQLLREFPSYPDSVSVYRKLLPLARKVGDKEEAARCEREIQRMSTNAPAVKN